MHYQKKAIITVLCLGMGRIGESQMPEDLVRATLVADVTGVTAGKPFTVGVAFEMKPDWHIYWHNPGEAGLATSVELVLPEGFQAGALGWPTPDRFVQPGDILGYGYSDKVLLATEVEPPASVNGAAVPIRAKVRWLACMDVCIPGRAELEMSLPVSSSTVAANRPLFSSWRSSLPVSASEARARVVYGAVGLRGDEASVFEVHVDLPTAPVEAQWFPFADKALRISDESVTTEGQRVTVRFKATVLKGQTPASRELPTVLAVTDRSGDRNAFNLPIPLEKAK